MSASPETSSGGSPSTRRSWHPGFTKTYGVILLVYYEEYASIVEARARERAIKRWRREWKMALVEKANPDWRDLADDIVP